MTEPPNDMRRVLAFLRDNPKSSIRHIASSAKLTEKEVSKMIKDELRLVTSKDEDGVTTVYSLPAPPPKPLCCGGACSRSRAKR